MQDPFDAIRDFTRRVEQAGIAYMVTGSMAMSCYGEPRMTRDIDVVIEVETNDIERVIQLFGDDYYVPRNSLQSAIERRSIFNVIHLASLYKIDCIVRKSSEYRVLEFARRRQVIVKGVTFWTVSKEDLIISKLDWARDSHSELQFRDVKNLMKAEYDAEYLERWTRELGLFGLWQECLHG